MSARTCIGAALLAELVMLPAVASAHPVEALSGAFGDEAVAFPLQRLGEWHFDPALRLRLELWPRELRHGSIGLYADAGLLTHRRVEIGLTTTSGGHYRFQHKRILYVEAWLGVGLGWLFLPDDAYEIQPDGSFAEARNHGRARALVQSGIGMGFPLPGIEGRPLSVFGSYEMVVEMPFASGIPLAPHTILTVGVRWSFADARRESEVP